MVFASLTFLYVFLPLNLLGYFALRRDEHRNFLLILFSLAFYAWGEPISDRVAAVLERGRLRPRANHRGQAWDTLGQGRGGLVAGHQPRPARAVQVQRLRLRGRQRPVRDLPDRAGPALAADRHLVLHLPDDLLRDRRVPRRAPGPALVVQVPAVRQPVSPSSSPGRSSATPTSPARSTIARTAWPTRPPGSAGSARACSRRSASPTSPGSWCCRPWPRTPPSCRSPRRWLGLLMLLAADLLRLLRLLRHGDRARADLRVPLPRELQSPLHRPLGPGLLAALAHLAARSGSATTCTSRSAATGAPPALREPVHRLGL